MSNVKGLDVGGGMVLPLDAVTEAIAILAVRRAGKSNAAVVMAEEMHRNNLHWIAIDPKGDWWGVRSSKDGKGAGLPVVIFGGKHGDVPLEPTSGAMIADLIVDQRISCVLDVSRFESDAAKHRFLAAFGNRLFARKDFDQEPTHIFLEEADDYIPQEPLNDQKHLINIMAKIVKQGGSRGIGVTIISQRSAVVNKKVLTQCGTMIALRTNSPQDRTAIKGWVSFHGENAQILEDLPGLEDGQAWVWSPHWLKQTKKFRFRRRSTFDSGSTPKVGASRRAPATLVDVDIDAIRNQMKEVVAKAEANDPTKLRMKIAELERKLAAKGPVQQVVKCDHEKTIKLLMADSASWRAFAEEAGQLLLGYTATIAAIRRQMEDSGKSQNAVIRLTDRFQAMVKKPLVLVDLPSGQVTRSPDKASDRPNVPRSPRPPAGEPHAGLTRPQQKIIDTIARLESLGNGSPTEQVVAALSGYTCGAGAWNNYRGTLITLGLVSRTGGKTSQISLTPEGRAVANVPESAPTLSELHSGWYGLLTNPQAKALGIVIDAFPKSISVVDLANKSGYTPGTGGFNNIVGRLRSIGAVVNDGPGRVKASDLVFPEGLS